VESYTVSGYDFTKGGTQTLVVTLNNKTATFTVSIQQVVLESISVAPLKTTYAYDEAFDNAHIVVTGRYSDGTTKREETESYTVTGYNPQQVGTQTLLVTTLNGKTATFTVYVNQVVLESIWVEALKTSYAYDEAFNSADIIVTGRYSDGTTKTVEDFEVRGYDSTKEGYQTVVISKDEKIATFSVTVGAKKQELSISIGLPNENQVPEIFGLPEEGIKLSVRQNNNLPRKIVISAAGSSGGDSAVYTNVSWYIDGGKYPVAGNILEISASDYALTIPHSITFVGTRGGVEYSRPILFTVEK
jgi:hypothetical protein